MCVEYAAVCVAWLSSLPAVAPSLCHAAGSGDVVLIVVVVVVVAVVVVAVLVTATW